MSESDIGPHGDTGQESAQFAVDLRRGFDMALQRAGDIDALKGLDGKVAAMEALARQMRGTLMRQNELAEMRIRIARRLGAILCKSVQRGGKRSRLQGATLSGQRVSGGLPSGISKSESHRLQKLAAIAEESFARYCANCRDALEPVSRAGLLRWHRKESGERPGRRGRRKRRAPAAELAPAELLAPVWGAALRVLGSVDIAVGVPGKLLGASCVYSTGKPPPPGLSGTVAGWLGADPEPWLEVLSVRAFGEEALVVVLAHTACPWFKQLEHGRWICCFLADARAAEPFVACYRGPRARAFVLTMKSLGTLLRAVSE